MTPCSLYMLRTTNTHASSLHCHFLPSLSPKAIANSSRPHFSNSISELSLKKQNTKTMEKLLLKSVAPASCSMKPLKLNNRLFSSFVPASPANVEGRKGKNERCFVCGSKLTDDDTKPSLGAIFFPFEEVKKELMLVPTAPEVSLARREYADRCEDAVNEQINVEYSVSYVYHAMSAYFERDNVALKGLAKFFKESSEEEKEHAEKLMEYQNKRGGRVKLHSLVMPLSEFDHAEKGDALYAMELALAFEMLTNEKLLNLHAVASQNNDAQLTDFIESKYLAQQVESIKKISEFVAQLRMVGKGHGVWHFDQMLLHQY